MMRRYDPTVRMIPVAQIHVLNPRQRGKKKFSQIVASIAKLGLKKPITVARAPESNGDVKYYLVCGQGRLEAYIELGETEIPAILVEGGRDDFLLMSLAENLARRQHSTVELLREIKLLKQRGYSHADIARKTAIDITYVRGILQLLDRGEDKLLIAVEKGQLPLSIAMTISISDDQGIQRALQEAYERNDLRGKSLIRARRLVENRRVRGKKPRRGVRIESDKPVSVQSLLRTFQQETTRQKLVVQKAKICETRLLFATSALRQLFQDDHFVTLLRAEGLDSLPEYLAEHIYGGGSNP
jgi:ParB family chromosome partitioning protein